MAKTTKNSTKRIDPMDGAVYPYVTSGKIPADFMIDETGIRKGESKPPWGNVVVDLTDGIDGKIIPPNFIWEEGEWKGKSPSAKDGNIWVVSGEGTPGNYSTREYKLPEKLVEKAFPPHPSKWSKELKQGRWSASKAASSSSGMPYGIRIRCLGCGHFFKMDDLANHAKSACPATQDPVLWVIECACHPNDLLTSATVLPGFPMKPPAPDEPETGPTDMDAPDMSGDLADQAKQTKEAPSVA